MALTPRADDPNKDLAEKDKLKNPHKWAQSPSLVTQSLAMAKEKREAITKAQKKVKKK